MLHFTVELRIRQQLPIVTSCVRSLVSIVTTLAYGNTHPAKRIVILKARISQKTKNLDEKHGLHFHWDCSDDKVFGSAP